jgi:cephalosporin-C deacetylase
VAHYDLPLDELRAYRPAIEEPTDLDAFWGDTVAEARAFGGVPILAKAEPPMPNVEVWDVTFPGFGGHPIKAWYSRPAGDRSDLPVIVQYQGSGWGAGGETPDPGGTGAAGAGYMTRGILDPADYYYRRLFTDGVRAVDAVRKLPGIDQARIFAAGVSQGGGVAIAVAALVPGLAAALVDVPFLCHYRRALAVIDTDPYAEITRYLSVHRDHTERAFGTLSYFDGATLGKRATAPALFSVALMDDTCPPSTVFAAFNAWGGQPKEILVYPYNRHEGGGAYQVKHQWQYVRRMTA